MTTKTYVDYTTVVDAASLNDFDAAVYQAIGDGTAPPITSADVRTNLGLTASGGAALIGNTPAGTIVATNQQAVNNELDAKPALQTNTAFTTAGTATAYTLTPIPALTALAANQRFRVKFNATSGAAPTLAVSGLVAKPLMYYNALGAKVECGATNIILNMLSDVEYDGVDYVVMAPAGSNAATANAIAASALAQVYPVGSIYTSTAATNPATLFGFGTWAAFGAGRVMMGAGGVFGAGTTGGSNDAVVVSHTHTATVSDPGHIHRSSGATGGALSGFSAIDGDNANNFDTTAATTGVTVSNSTNGVSGTNANLPPYIVVYLWNRTA